MTASQSSWSFAVPALAVVLGLLAASFDVAAPFGDDTAKGTLLLWLASSGLLGFLQPHRPWRWALLVGPWVPATHFVLHALGRPDSLLPNSYTTILLLVPTSLAVCLLAACSGALLRKAGRR